MLESAGRFVIRDDQTRELAPLSVSTREVADACARLWNAVERATVAYLDEWLAA
jgi:hypothetical protein